MANFIFSAFATGSLKIELDNVKNTLEDQEVLSNQLASDTDSLAKRISANCQKVIVIASPSRRLILFL